MSAVGHQSSLRVRHRLPGLLEIVGYLLNVAFRGFEQRVLRRHRGLRQTTS
jgi:hypothetical protein